MFKFKIWDHIKLAWPIYKKNFGILLLLSAVTVIVSSAGSDDNWYTSIFSYLIVFLLTFVWIKYALNLVDEKKHDFFTKMSLPDLKQYWNITKTIILTSLIIISGFILLIIPGFYFSGRLLFAIYISVEKNQGAIKNISDSWEMTRNSGWKIFWKSFIISLFMAIGFIFFGVGALVTYPIGYLVLGMMYRDFQKWKIGKNDIKDKESKKDAEQVEVEKVNE